MPRSSESAPSSRTTGTERSGSRVELGWKGLSREFQERATEAAASGLGERFRRGLAGDLAHIRGKISPLGSPLLIRRDHGATLRQFAGAYHRGVETIAHAWSSLEEVRRVVALPPELRSIIGAAPAPATARIHLCRLDLLLGSDGGFSVLETNANCPGALLSTGWAGRKWREYLSEAGVHPPAPLLHEARRWMARWLIHTAQAETGEAPDLVVLLRWENGNRLELPGLAGGVRRSRSRRTGG